MSKFSRFALVASLVSIWGWVQAAPPQGPARGRPVVIDAPIPEPDDPAHGGRPAKGRLLVQANPGRDAEPEPATPRSATDELSHARERLLKYGSIQARIVETVSTFDRSYKAEGRYLQKGLKTNDWQMRLELTLKIGDSEGNLLEVCDGDVLWTSMQFDLGRKSAKKKEKKEHAITRRNVTQILAAARKQGEKAETTMIADLGLGGLPGLLAAIEKEMTFGDVKEETLRDRPVIVIEGTWNDEFREKIRDPRQEEGASSALLPPFVPDAVRILLDRETRFPLRIQYLKKIPNREVQRDALILDFLEIELDQPIDKQEFTYDAPTGVQQVDLTNYFLDQIAPAAVRGRGGDAK